MTPDTPEQITKALVSIDTKVLTLVYGDLAKPGVKQVGKALATVLGLGNTVLLPIKLLNEKAQLLYAAHMEEYRKKLEKIPEDKVVEVAPEIGIPILENLEKTTSKKVSELYINLLANASTIDFVADTHPSFVTIIESLTSDEVKILESFRANSIIGFISIIGIMNMQEAFGWFQGFDTSATKSLQVQYPSGEGYRIINPRATLFEKDKRLSLPEKAKFYLQHLESLGLIQVTESRIKPGSIEPVIEAFKDEIEIKMHATKITLEEGNYRLSEFGYLFLKACQNKPEGNNNETESAPSQ